MLLKFSGSRFDDKEPIKMWFGVSGSISRLPSLMTVRDLLLKVDSTSNKKALRQPFMMVFKERFIELFRDFEISSIQRLTGGLRNHVILLWLKNLINLVWSNYLTLDFNFFLTPTKLVSLSDGIICTASWYESEKSQYKCISWIVFS